MTVSDLMKRLAKMDPAAVVVVPGYEQGVDGVDRVEEVTLELHTSRYRDGIPIGQEGVAESYEGAHRVATDGVPGVLIASTRHDRFLDQ